MGNTFTPSKAEAPEIEEGLYEADFEGIQPGPDGQYGPSIQWNFTAYIDGEPEKVNGLSSPSTSVNGKAYGWLTAILGRQPEVDEKVDLDALKGSRCRVLVEDNKKGWPTVTDVKPASKKKAE